MLFSLPEYEQFFQELLCDPGENLSRYAALFDFRPPEIKRREFNRKRRHLLAQLLEQYGRICQLNYPELCDIDSGIQVDHIIPLASNKLNKELRQLPPPSGKKVPAESFGSNNPQNLIITCRNCNVHKMHRFLSREMLKRVLSTKEF